VELGISIQPEPCQKHSDLLIIVISLSSEYEQRSQLRESWIKEAKSRNYTVYFLLGTIDNQTDLLEEEAEEYKDIILVDVREDYKNLPLKTYVALKWKEKKCPGTKWLLKLDMDTDVFVDNLERLLLSKEGARNAIFGQVVKGAVIHRYPESKWCVYQCFVFFLIWLFAATTFERKNSGWPYQNQNVR
jgi:hypothetical protein